MAANPAAQPNPALIFDALTAYQKCMALKGAIDLELFTHIADGAVTVQALAATIGRIGTGHADSMRLTSPFTDFLPSNPDLRADWRF